MTFPWPLCVLTYALFSVKMVVVSVTIGNSTSRIIRLSGCVDLWPQQLFDPLMQRIGLAETRVY